MGITEAMIHKRCWSLVLVVVFATAGDGVLMTWYRLNSAALSQSSLPPPSPFPRHCHHFRGCGRARLPCLRLRPPRHRRCCQNQLPAVLLRQVCNSLLVSETVMTRAPVKSQQPSMTMVVDRNACYGQRTVWASSQQPAASSLTGYPFCRGMSETLLNIRNRDLRSRYFI